MKWFFIVGSIIYAFVILFVSKFCKQSNMPEVASSESLARLAVKDGGGRWVGIQEVEGGRDLVLFNSPTTGSTLALNTREINADRVRQHITQSDRVFQGN